MFYPKKVDIVSFPATTGLINAVKQVNTKVKKHSCSQQGEALTYRITLEQLIWIKCYFVEKILDYYSTWNSPADHRARQNQYSPPVTGSSISLPVFTPSNKVNLLWFTCMCCYSWWICCLFCVSVSNVFILAALYTERRLAVVSIWICIFSWQHKFSFILWLKRQLLWTLHI